jgi:DNA modification methylase
MGGARAAMAITDPPYNLKVANIVGRGRTKHAEFAMASGEMSKEAFTAFLTDALRGVAGVMADGALAYVFMDWRHIGDLVVAGEVAFDEMVNLCVWAKSNAGQGSFYRSQHELVGVFRTGKAPHQNNVELGRHGRSRSNLWHYPGVNSFRRGRLEDLAAHPTVKPVALVADAIKDCTRRREVVVDTFCGAGTTILAAERVGRAGYGVEIEPRFVDAAVRRWQRYAGKDAVHHETGRTFDEEASGRLSSP